MAYGYDRDEREHRGEGQRGDWRRNDDSRNSRSSNEYDRNQDRDRNWSQRAFGSGGSNDDYRRDDDMRSPLLGSQDRDTYGRSNRSYGEPYGNRSYRHGTGQGYGGEDQWGPGYGGQGGYGTPGSSSYGSSSHGAGSYGSGNYGSGGRYGSSSRDYNRDYEHDLNRSSGREYGTAARGMGFTGGPSQSGSGYGGGYSGSSYGGPYGGTYGGHSTSGYGGNESQYGNRYGRDDSTSMRSSYAGRGPKGYKRSDDRIKEDVCDRLSMDDDVDASDITVSVRNGEVTLDGSVETRRMKHRAEDIAEEVPGVSDVHNNVRVVKGLINEMVDRVTGNERDQHFANSGTRNTPNGTSASSSTTAGQGTTSPAR